MNILSRHTDYSQNNPKSVYFSSEAVFSSIFKQDQITSRWDGITLILHRTKIWCTYMVFDVDTNRSCGSQLKVHSLCLALGPGSSLNGSPQSERSLLDGTLGLRVSIAKIGSSSFLGELAMTESCWHWGAGQPEQSDRVSRTAGLARRHN